jgi:hypothetical protein
MTPAAWCRLKALDDEGLPIFDGHISIDKELFPMSPFCLRLTVSPMPACDSSESCTQLPVELEFGLHQLGGPI